MKPVFVTTPRVVVVCAIALVAATTLVPEARADLIPPGHRSVRTDVLLDLGPFAKTAPREYTVVEGDTLAKIAEARLGDQDRWREIAALNPGLEPHKLKPKQKIVIPPAPGKKGAAPAIGYHFFSFRFTLPSFIRKQHAKRPLSAPRRLFHGQAPWITKHGAIFVAVPDAKLEAWRKALAAGLTTADLEKLRADGVAAVMRVGGVSGLVRDDDAVKRMCVTLVIERVDGKLLVVNRKVEKLDAAGKKIGMAARRRDLLLASGAGLLGLVAVAVRRRRAARRAGNNR